MRKFVFVPVSILLALTAIVACSDSSDSDDRSGDDAGGGDGGTNLEDTGANPVDGGVDSAEAAAPYVEPTDCNLRDDTGGPGQYSDGCVKREWIAPYAGTYTSAMCELTVSITGSVAATFTMNVLSGELAGEYTTDFDGLPSPGNDSYYRFTTDATFATTKTINYASGQKIGTGDERALSLRIEGLDVDAVVYKGRYSEVIGGTSRDVDCGTMTKN